MPFYLEMSKNTTQQRDIYDIYIYIYKCVFVCVVCACVFTLFQF